MGKKMRLTSGFTLGGEQAEADPYLLDAFYNSDDYEVIASRQDARCFVIGRTGSGKSAALQYLQDTGGGHVIRINPEDLSLPYITDLQAIRYLDELNVNLDLFWIALWKHVLLVEVIRERYKVNTPGAKETMLAAIRTKISRDPAKKAALAYLDEFEGRFWCETDERVREITDQFADKINGEVGVNANTPLTAGVGASASHSHEVRKQQAERFQRIVNSTQLAKAK